MNEQQYAVSLKPTYEIQYCSWCFEKTHHNLHEKNLLRRNIYKCSKCDNLTVMCRYCKNMSKSGKWDSELCAEHDGTISNFSTLDEKLSDIGDYKILFKGNKWNLLKAAKITALTIGGAAVLSPLAFAAAPAIGGAFGTYALGLSGAAATNAGLAAIGGGAISAGGLGIAGGTAILGATGAALGGTIGGVVASSYFGDIEGFEIERIKGGHGPVIIFVDGFLREKRGQPTEWIENLKKLYPDNPWYYVRWESKRLADIGKIILSTSGSTYIKSQIFTWAAQASKVGASSVNPILYMMTVLNLANNPWSIASIKAGQTGILLADIIARTDEKYILIGHSLGARVLYYLLMALATKEKKFIDCVHLLGGAVGNDRSDWYKCADAVENMIYNYYTSNDWILLTLYKSGTFFVSKPIGRNPIPANDKVKNIDVSECVKGHSQFKDFFDKYARI